MNSTLLDHSTKPLATSGDLLRNPFVVTNTTAKRKDLAERKEMKFIVAGADIQKLRTVIAQQCKPVVHGDESFSKVRSVYFDDAQLANAYANLDGLGNRTKLRIRWYDSKLPSKHFFVEIKWRKNRITGKHRFKVESRIPLSDVPFRQIIMWLEEALPAEFARAVVATPEPIVLVQYKREHYVTVDSDIRFTIDYGLKFCEQIGHRSISNSFAVHMNDFALIEGKSSINTQQVLRQLLHPFQLRVGRCSKYVHGCRSIGRIAPNALL